MVLCGHERLAAMKCKLVCSLGMALVAFRDRIICFPLDNRRKQSILAKAINKVCVLHCTGLITHDCSPVKLVYQSRY